MQANSGKGAGAAAEDELIGQLVAERYRVVRRLGQGGMGTVYHAVHEKLRKPVALKLLDVRCGNDKEVVARFEREAVASANLRHPNIAEASDFGRLPDGSLYLVMELVDGKTARALLDESRRGLPPERVARILRQVAAALSRAHAQDVVHRDLKPENIIVFDRDDERDAVKVIDFGIARIRSAVFGAAGTALTVQGAVFGTPEYMAPEQVMGQAADARADQYAFGVMAFELLTGRLPFAESDVQRLLMKHISAPIPSARETAPHLAPAVNDVFAKLLGKRPEERYPTIEQAFNALEAALIGGPSAPLSAGTVRLDSPASLPAAVAMTAPGPALYGTPSQAHVAMPSQAHVAMPSQAHLAMPSQAHIAAAGAPAPEATPARMTAALPSALGITAPPRPTASAAEVVRAGTARIALTSKIALDATAAVVKKNPLVAGGAALAGVLFLVLLIALIAHAKSSSLPSEVRDALDDWEDGAYAQAAPKLRSELGKSATLASDPELVRAVSGAVENPDGRGALKGLLDDTRLGRSPVMAAALADIALGKVSAARNGALRLLRGRADLLASDQRARVVYRDADDCAALERALQELEQAATDRAKVDLDGHRSGHCPEIVRREEICGCTAAVAPSGRGKKPSILR